jgi:hypothetical protein
MLKPKHLIRTLTALIIFVVCALTAIAQIGTSNITGTVRDTSGAVVPGATVTAKNDATGVTGTQTTNDSGLYAFTALPVGLIFKQGLMGGALSTSWPLLDLAGRGAQLEYVGVRKLDGQTLRTEISSAGRIRSENQTPF